MPRAAADWLLPLLLLLLVAPLLPVLLLSVKAAKVEAVALRGQVHEEGGHACGTRQYRAGGTG